MNKEITLEIKNAVSKGYSVEEIAEALELTVESVQEVIKEGN